MRRINRKSVLIDVLALRALTCHKLGEETAALEKLQAALELAEQGGWTRNFLDLGAPLADLLTRLNQVHPDHLYTQQVLEVFRAEARSKMASGPESAQTSPVGRSMRF